MLARTLLLVFTVTVHRCCVWRLQLMVLAGRCRSWCCRCWRMLMAIVVHFVVLMSGSGRNVLDSGHVILGRRMRRCQHRRDARCSFSFQNDFNSGWKVCLYKRDTEKMETKKHENREISISHHTGPMVLCGTTQLATYQWAMYNVSI